MILSSFALKLIAIITMFCDHLGYAIYGKISWLNYIGRIAFPIFAWQITIGADKTKNEKKYFIRILLLAIISQPIIMVYLFCINNSICMMLNILFSFSLGILSIIAFKKNEKIGLIYFLLSAIIAELLNIDYGSYGIIMIMIFYLFKDKKNWMIFLNIINLSIYIMNTHSIIQIYSIIALLPILLYNEKKGKNVKYLFYIFYPLHLLILALYMMFIK